MTAACSSPAAGGSTSRFCRASSCRRHARAALWNVEPEVSRQQLIDASGQVAQAAPLEPLIARVRQSRREATDTIEWPDGAERVDAIPLAGRDGAVLGVLLIGSSGRELAALVSRIRWSGAAFGALGLAIGFVLSYVVAARVTRPVEQLAEASRSVASGDWDVRVGDVHASGEIEELARDLDKMRQLVDQRERLIQTERVAPGELAGGRRTSSGTRSPLRITLKLRRARRCRARSSTKYSTKA